MYPKNPQREQAPVGSDTIEIEDLNHQGKGVGRLSVGGQAVDGQSSDKQSKGKACFVEGALPGETVRWRRTQTKRSFDEGELIEVLQASPDRATPKCQYVHECGGCELQHLDSQAQWRVKEDQLKSTFAREDIEPESWAPALAGNPWEYRRRTRLAVAFAGKQAFLGYRQRSSHKVVPIESCVVLEPALNKLIQPLRELLSQTATSGLKQAKLDQIELVAGDNQVAVCLSVKQMPNENTLEAVQDFCAEQSAQLWIKEGRAKPVSQNNTGEQYEPLNAALVDGLSMQFTPAQFVQTNAEMNRKMIEQAMEWLDVQPEHHALDLFCGAGNFSLPIAKRAKSMLGVEGLSDLIAQADMNAAREGLTNTEFKVADLSKEDALLGKSFSQGTFDRVLLDPPRTGAKELIPALLKMAAPKLVYISCHPATLVRDSKTLIEGGYKLSKAGVIDMFPQTTHLESMALFER